MNIQHCITINFAYGNEQCSINNRTARATKFGVSRNDLTRDFDEFSVVAQEILLRVILTSDGNGTESSHRPSSRTRTIVRADK